MQMTKNLLHTWRVSASCLEWVPPWQTWRLRLRYHATPLTPTPWEARATIHSPSDSAWRDLYSAMPRVLLALARCLPHVPPIHYLLWVLCEPWPLAYLEGGHSWGHLTQSSQETKWVQHVTVRCWARACCMYVYIYFFTLMHTCIWGYSF